MKKYWTFLWHRVTRTVDVYSRYYGRKQEPIVIYTTGRVGSMALSRSLTEHDMLVFSVHRLSAVKKNPLWLMAGSEFWVYHNLIRRTVPIKIISVVRDPIAMMVTEYFTKLRWMTGDDNAPVKLNMDEIIDRFTQQYFEQGRHTRLLSWFDNEMNDTIGLDVYQHPSPAGQGYVRFKANRFTVLLYRLDIDDALKSSLVGEFAGLPEFKLTRSNISELRPYGPNYKALKDQVRIPPQRLDEVYGSRYAKHFFTEAEIDALRKRWGG